jgi:hypothetical protein
MLVRGGFPWGSRQKISLYKVQGRFERERFPECLSIARSLSAHYREGEVEFLGRVYYPIRKGLQLRSEVRFPAVRGYVVRSDFCMSMIW